MRIGIGYDIHRLVEGRPLVLGGVTFDYPKGLAGHSDGDVAVHAVCDAVLGAAGLDDIGQLFPDTDAAFHGIDSLLLLERAMEKVGACGLKVLNVDCIIVTEEPKIGPHREAIRAKLAHRLQVDPSRVSVKGKTHEKLGEIGRGEAIAAHAVALLHEI